MTSRKIVTESPVSVLTNVPTRRNVFLMETTQTTSPRRNHVAAIVKQDGATFGRVTLRGRDRFEAVRANGVQGVDIRRVSSFRSLAAAIAWIEAAA